MSIAVFVLFKNKFKNIKVNKTFRKLITNLSKYTLFIYMAHVIFIILLENDILKFNPILSVPIISLIIFTISALLAAGFSKVPIVNKFIM